MCFYSIVHSGWRFFFVIIEPPLVNGSSCVSSMPCNCSTLTVSAVCLVWCLCVGVCVCLCVFWRGAGLNELLDFCCVFLHFFSGTVNISHEKCNSKTIWVELNEIRYIAFHFWKDLRTCAARWRFPLLVHSCGQRLKGRDHCAPITGSHQYAYDN